MYINKIRYLLVALLSVFVVSCVTTKDTTYLQDTKVAYPKGEFTDYRIRPDDELSIRVLSSNQEVSGIFFNGGAQGANMQSTYRVFGDGTIDIPFIRKIKVDGLTLREATHEIETRLQDYIKEKLAVKVSVVNKYFYMIGESNAKGQFPVYKDKMTIFEAIALGGDLGVPADRKQVKIIRKVDGVEKIMKFDLRSKSIIDSEYYYVQPNDIIYVGLTKGGFFKITSFSTFLGVVTSSLSFILLVIQYSK
jgi:polysaccharide export outer membrane protein